MAKLLYIVSIVVIIVGIDLLFFRSHAWTAARLLVNVGIILIAGAFYLRFLR